MESVGLRYGSRKYYNDQMNTTRNCQSLGLQRNRRYVSTFTHMGTDVATVVVFTVITRIANLFISLVATIANSRSFATVVTASAATSIAYDGNLVTTIASSLVQTTVINSPFATSTSSYKRVTTIAISVTIPITYSEICLVSFHWSLDRMIMNDPRNNIGSSMIPLLRI